MLLASVAAMLLGTCSSSPGASVATSGSIRPPAGPAASPATSGSTGGRGSIMQVNIRSGKDQGSHYAFSQQPTCTYGVAGQGAARADSWASQFQGGPEDLSAVSIVVPNGQKAKLGDGSPTFTFSAVVKGTMYTVDTQAAAASGRGLAKVSDFGRTAAISIDARTADGTRVDAVIQCNVISGPDGQPIG